MTFGPITCGCFLVICCIPTSVVGQQDNDHVVELYEQWRAWADTLETPRRLAYTYSDPDEREFGFSSETVVSYFGKRHFSYERDATPIPGMKQAASPQLCRLYCPEYFCIIARDVPSEAWTVIRLDEARKEQDFLDPFRMFIDIPGDIPRSGKALDELYAYEVLTADQESITVRFSVNSPKAEWLVRAMGTVDEFVVTFSSSCGWLPCRMDRHFREGGFWWSACFSDWRRFDDITIPTVVSESSGRDGTSEPFLTFHVSDLSMVPESEVVEHCHLSFYGISEPQVDRGIPANKRTSLVWPAAGVVAGLFVVAFILLSRRRVSRR